MCHIPVNSDPPHSLPLTAYPPPPPPSKPPNHSSIPPPHSTATLHYPAYTSHSTHLSPVTSHPPVGHSLPSTSPPSTRWPFNSLHITSDMSVGQSMQSTITVTHPTHHPLHNGHPVQPFNSVLLPFCTVHRSRHSRCHHFPFSRQPPSSLQSTTTIKTW
jgi:hypothetical protein